MVTRSLLKVFFLLCAFLSVSACGEVNARVEGGLTLDDVYGEYEVERFKKYGGGVTSDEDARKLLGSKVVVRKDVFRTTDWDIENPIYKLEKIEFKGEGNVLPRDLSVFYGLENDKDYVLVLKVFSSDDPSEWVERYEVIKPGELLYMFDGRFFFLSAND